MLLLPAALVSATLRSVMDSATEIKLAIFLGLLAGPGAVLALWAGGPLIVNKGVKPMYLGLGGLLLIIILLIIIF